MKYWFYHVVKTILWVFFRLGYGLEVTGVESIPSSGPFILASNHISFLDPPLLGAACPRRLSFMARRDLFRNALLGGFMRGVHVIPLARGEADPSAIHEAVRRLRRGDAVAIFPEGGRQLSGQLGAARRGVGLLAALAQVPIIPALVSGTYEAMPPESKGLHRSKIRVAFGTQIPYTTDSLRPARSQHERLAEAVTQQWRHLATQLKP